VALAIDGSSPAITTQTSGTTATVATGSFTPPAGALLLIGWAGNTGSASDPGAPSITDNLGGHLTYNLVGWKHRGVAPTVDGQAAMWWAVVGSSTAMTVTVTTGTGSGAQQAALKVWVITGADTSGIGASGLSGSASAASIAQSYTAQATGGQSFIAVCDWDLKGVETAGTGATRDGSANVGTDITYGFFHRTSADDSNGVSNTLNVTLPGTSTNLDWVYAEIKPAAGGGGSGTWLPGLISRRRPAPRLQRARVEVPPLDAPLAPGFEQPARRHRGVRARGGRTFQPAPAQAVVQPPTYPTQQEHIRVRGLRLFRPRIAAPVPAQVVVAPPPYPPRPVRERLKGARLFRPDVVTPVPAQVVLTAPLYPPTGLRARVRGLRLFRSRAAVPVPQQTLPVAPTYVPQQDPRPRFRTRPVRGRIAAPPLAQLQPPLLTRARRKVARLWRGEVWMPVPAQVVFIAPPRAPQTTKVRRNQFAARRHRGGVEGWMVGGSHLCVITRPNTGTTGRTTSTTPRPDTGITEAPC
jgi:hypothetical protein